MTNTMPTVAELVAVAERAYKMIGTEVLLAGRWYRVVRYHTELRFFQTSGLIQGEIPRSTHVEIVTPTKARVPAGIPGRVGSDAELEARATAMVMAAL